MVNKNKANYYTSIIISHVLCPVLFIVDFGIPSNDTIECNNQLMAMKSGLVDELKIY